MMKCTAKLVAILLIVLGLYSCAEDKKVVGNYYLSRFDDVAEYQVLSYKLENPEGYIGVVPFCVFAVGFNNDFIIVKQHPVTASDSINKSITNYYVVPMKSPVSKHVDENRIGPLSKIEFDMKRKELGVPEDIEFSIVFKDLE